MLNAILLNILTMNKTHPPHTIRQEKECIMLGLNTIPAASKILCLSADLCFNIFLEEILCDHKLPKDTKEMYKVEHSFPFSTNEV